jgi:hypothetical protein
MDGRRLALIVANDDYEDAGLREVAPVADAQALSEVLGDPHVGGFEVRLVHNAPAHTVRTSVEHILSEGRPDDLLLLHFSCHGLMSESGELFFAARDTRPNRLVSTATSAEFLKRCMQASRSLRIVLLLDCWYGVAFSQGGVAVRASGDAHVLDAFPAGELGRGRAVIMASSSRGLASEEDALAENSGERWSLFTSAIVDGLSTGDADRDEDGWVSLNELYDYVVDRVREQDPGQTLSLAVEMEGEIRVARGRRRPLPAVSGRTESLVASWISRSRGTVIPPVVDENVQFTVYRPQTIRPGVWYPMLAFAHLAERRPDGPADAPDPIEQVKALARQALGDRTSAYASPTSDARGAIPKEGELTFVPTMEGVEFNPPRRVFRWLEDVHKEDFRLRANAGPQGQVLRGQLTVFLGAFILADVHLAIKLDETAVQPPTTPEGPMVALSPTLEPAQASPYRKIFPSYSHRDSEIVEQAQRLGAALGDVYLRDRTMLRSGEEWSARLLELIDEADVFQLFWSSNSMLSEYVRQEWEYANSLARRNFIRPTYWEEPMPRSDDPLLPPDSLRSLHFHCLALAATPAPRPTVAAKNRVSAPTPRASQPSPTPRSTPAPGSPPQICPRCRETNPSYRRYCSRCGQYLAWEDQGGDNGSFPSQTSTDPESWPSVQARPMESRSASAAGRVALVVVSLLVFVAVLSFVVWLK